jgi:hypothetical protein
VIGPVGHETTVDYNGDERDPAWRAYCETGHWAGVWHHADEYPTGGSAALAAQIEGLSHQSDSLSNV